jgi:hypothetical protein
MLVSCKSNVKRTYYQKDAYLEQDLKEITIKIIKRQKRRKVLQVCI